MIGPERAVPVSLIGQSFPSVIDELERELADPEALSGAGRFVMRPLGNPAATAVPRIELTAREGELMALIGAEPKAMRRVAVLSGAQRSLAALARKGLVQIAGLTPSDAAHVLGLQDNWLRAAADAAARLAARGRGLGPPTGEAAAALCREIWSETVRLSARALLEVAIGASDLAAGRSGNADRCGKPRPPAPGGAGRHRAQAGPAGGGGGRPGQGLSPGSGAPARLRDRLSGALGGGQCGGRRQRRGGAQRHHCRHRRRGGRLPRSPA